MSKARQWLRQQGAGRFLYRWVHRPVEAFSLGHSFGWRLVARAWWGEREMRRAALLLPSLPAANRRLASPICFLTGRRFFHQTLFCAHSFAAWSGVAADYIFLSDGSLGPEHLKALETIFPGARVPGEAAQHDTLERALPERIFPTLHRLRPKFVLLRKLTDAMAGAQGYRLFFDSDMLFWNQPRELLERAAACEPLYMTDTVDDGYTATRATLTAKFGVPVATAVNSGLVGLVADKIDWELMERVCAFLLTVPGDRRLLEQTLWAVALGSQQARALPASGYRVVVDPPHWKRSRQEFTPTLLHYAWRARLPYTAHEWRRYISDALPLHRTSKTPSPA